MRYRTVALLLLILIAFSVVSCNEGGESEITENNASQVIEQTQGKTEKATEEKKYSKRSEIPEEKIEEIKKYYDLKVVPKYFINPSGTYDFAGNDLELQTHGMFGEACAIYAKKDSRTVHWEYIGGFEFRYTDSPPLIYYNQEFFELGEALEKKIIYNGDLEIIYESYKKENYNICYKQYVEPSLDWTFYGKAVYVIVQPQYNDKVYTVEDFADIGCVAIEEATSKWDDFENNPNRICKRWLIHLDRQSKEWVIEVFKILYEREDVFLVQTDSYNEFAASPNDTEYVEGNQWAINHIKMPQAWDIQNDASTVRVGIIDSGVALIDELYYNLKLHINPYLSKSFVSGSEDPFTDTYGNGGHGTKVASIIGSTSNNATGMVGICWDVQLVSLRIDAHTSEFIEALDYAAENDIFVVNYSVGADKEFDYDEYKAIERFPGLVVCCAGNHKSDNDSVPYYPESYNLDNIIVVGASDSQGKRWKDSNYGATTVDLFAPGSMINVMTKDGTYMTVSATSYAAPMVTGVIALMKARYPNKSREWIKEKLLESVTIKSGNYLKDKCVTEGVLNAHRALCEHSSSNIQYTQTATGQHIMTCNACGYKETAVHRYIYTSLNKSQHRVYCACGYSVVEAHNCITDTNQGVIYCSKCAYRLELWNIKEEPELQ